YEDLIHAIDEILSDFISQYARAVAVHVAQRYYIIVSAPVAALMAIDNTLSNMEVPLGAIREDLEKNHNYLDPTEIRRRHTTYERALVRRREMMEYAAMTCVIDTLQVFMRRVFKYNRILIRAKFNDMRTADSAQIPPVDPDVLNEILADWAVGIDAMCSWNGYTNRYRAAYPSRRTIPQREYIALPGWRGHVLTWVAAYRERRHEAPASQVIAAYVKSVGKAVYDYVKARSRIT